VGSPAILRAALLILPHGWVAGAQAYKRRRVMWYCLASSAISLEW